MFGSWVRRITKPRRKSIALGLLAASLFLIVWSQVVRFHRSGIIAVQRAQTADQLGDRILTLRLTVEKRLAAAESLAAFLRVTPAADLPADLPPFLRQIYERTPHLRAIWAAPHGVITYFYPEEGNQALRNLDLKHDTRLEVRGAVDLALRTGKLTITPPHPLIQGGTGITATLAVEAPGGRWLVGVCADFPALLEEAGFDGKAFPLLIAARGPDGKVAFGPSSLFSARPVLKTLDLGGGRWEFGAVPAAGWGAEPSEDRAAPWASGALIALLLFWSTYLLVNRRERLHEGIRAKTAIISRLNEELQAELSAREESEARFASFMRYLPALAFLRDAEGRYVYVNEAWERLTGKAAQETLGRPVDEVLPPGEARAILEEDAQILGGEELLWDQERLVIDGRESWWISSKFPVQDAQGRVNLIGGISIEVTDRKRAEETLRESEERYQTLFNHTSDGILLIDGAGRIIDANEVLVERLGYGRDELLQMTVMDIDAPESAHLAQERIDQVRREGHGLFQVSHRTRDGRVIPTEISTRMITFRGRQLILSVVRDVTERKRAEKLRQTLYTIAKAASTSSDLQELYQLVHREVMAHMPAKNFYIALFDDDKGLLSFPYWVDEMDPQPEPEPLGRNLTTYVLRHGRSILVNEAVHAELQRQGEAQLDGAPSKVWLGVPLKVGDRAIGVMAVQDYADPLAYGEEDLHLLEFVSSEVAQSLQRRLSTEALRTSEQKYRAILDNMEEGYYEVDLQGNLTFANGAFYRIFGRPEHELLGASYRSVMTPDTVERIFSTFHRIFTTGQRETGTDWEIFLPDGSVRAFEASASPIQVSEGRYSGFRGVVRDVTTRRAAEDALAESEERYRKLFERSLAGVYKTSLDGRLLDCNAAFAAMLGAAGPEAIIHTSILDRYADPSGRLPFIEALKREGKVSGMEVRLLRLDGKPIHVLISAALVHDEPGHGQVIEGSIIDITAREALARERLRARGLETIGTIAGGVAHEVRNPLFAIQVNLEALARRCSPEAEAQSFLDNVLEHARRLNSLMQSLLELGQASSGEQIILSDPRQLVAEAVALAEEDDPRLHGRITTTFRDRPEPFLGAPKRIVKALLHILDNAAQVSPPDGDITVACLCKDGVCSISVSDRGPGLPPSIRNRLFEPFVTASAHRRGLGLALARHYVESCGGTIEAADNDPPPGATFTVKLPLA